MKVFAADKMGISHISGIDKLNNGKQAQELLSKVEELSENGRHDCHEYVADLLSAKNLTKSQKKLKDSIMKILETRR